MTAFEPTWLADRACLAARRGDDAAASPHRGGRAGDDRPAARLAAATVACARALVAWHRGTCRWRSATPGWRPPPGSTAAPASTAPTGWRCWARWPAPAAGAGRCPAAGRRRRPPASGSATGEGGRRRAGTRRVAAIDGGRRELGDGGGGGAGGGGLGDVPGGRRGLRQPWQRRPQAARRRLGQPHPHRAAGRPAGRRGAAQRHDRHPPLPLDRDREEPPLPHLHEARRDQPRRTCRRGRAPARRVPGHGHGAPARSGQS